MGYNHMASNTKMLNDREKGLRESIVLCEARKEEAQRQITDARDRISSCDQDIAEYEAGLRLITRQRRVD